MAEFDLALIGYLLNIIVYFVTDLYLKRFGDGHDRSVLGGASLAVCIVPYGAVLTLGMSLLLCDKGLFFLIWDWVKRVATPLAERLKWEKTRWIIPGIASFTLILYLFHIYMR